MAVGTADAVAPEVATDIPLISAGARWTLLKLLAGAGITSFVARSGLGYNFVCHTRDLAGFPFYHRRAYQAELSLCAAWLREEHHPVVFDVGANCGFVSTQLAQMLSNYQPKIYAFEPVPTTFAKLVQSVQRLGLGDHVHAIKAAATDSAGPVRISYSDRNSLHAQLTSNGLNGRVGDRLAHAQSTTLDGFCALLGIRPSLLKVDVEGSEAAVFRGAQDLLSGPDRPAIAFEYNPVTLVECGASVHSLMKSLSGYAIHYVDDLRGQKMPFGSRVRNVEEIDWICNLFAVPLVETSIDRWKSISKVAMARAGMKRTAQPRAADSRLSDL